MNRNLGGVAVTFYSVSKKYLWHFRL